MDEGSSSTTKPAAAANKKINDNCAAAIISFMETPHAVQSFALSRGWRHLWQKVTAINFNINSDYAKAAGEYRSVIRANFGDRILQTLTVRDHIGARILELRVVFHSADEGAREHEIWRWVQGAVDRGVRKLDLNFGDDYSLRIIRQEIHAPAIDRPVPFQFRFAFLLGSQVSEVRLNHCYFSCPAFSNLGSLRRVWLSDILAVEDREITNVVSSCVNLVEFHVNGVIILQPVEGRIEIHSTKLKILSLRSVNDELLRVTLSIMAPALSSLTMSDFEIGPVLLSAPSLLNARIEYQDLPLQNVGWLSIHNVGMNLGRSQIEMLTFPPFLNLVRPELVTRYCSHSILALVQYIKASPILQNLILDHSDSYYKSFSAATCIDEGGVYSDHLSLPEWFMDDCTVCNIPSLKRVVLKNYRKTRNERFVVDLFIRNRAVLQSITAIPPAKHGKSVCSKFLLWGFDEPGNPTSIW